MIMLFIIVYIDQRNPVFSQIWKVFLLLGIFIDVLRIKIIHYRRPAFLKFAYLWGAKKFHQLRTNRISIFYYCIRIKIQHSADSL